MCRLVCRPTIWLFCHLEVDDAHQSEVMLYDADHDYPHRGGEQQPEAEDDADRRRLRAASRPQSFSSRATRTRVRGRPFRTANPGGRPSGRFRDAIPVTSVGQSLASITIEWVAPWATGRSASERDSSNPTFWRVGGRLPDGWRLIWYNVL